MVGCWVWGVDGTFLIRGVVSGSRWIVAGSWWWWMVWLLSVVFFGWWLGGFVAGFGGLVVRFLMWWDQVGGSR